MVVLTYPASLSRSVTSRPPKAVLLLQIEIIRPGLHLLSQSVTGRANLRAQMLQIEMLNNQNRYPRSCVVVFQFVIDIRTGEKVCYTLSRCPHRLAAKDATLSWWISRVRIPLGAPFEMRSPLPSRWRAFLLPYVGIRTRQGEDPGIIPRPVCKKPGPA